MIQWKFTKTQLEVISEAIKASNAKMDEFVAIGITNQRETTVVWNKETGKPIYMQLYGNVEERRK